MYSNEHNLLVFHVCLLQVLHLNPASNLLNLQKLSQIFFLQRQECTAVRVGHAPMPDRAEHTDAAWRTRTPAFERCNEAEAGSLYVRNFGLSHSNEFTSYPLIDTKLGVV